MRVPDSTENREHFGGQTARWESISGYPMARMVTLMALRSHILAVAKSGPYATGETVLAEALWPLVPDHSVTTVARGFFSARTLISLEREGIQRHWLTRAKCDLASTRIERYAAGDELVELNVSGDARHNDASMPATWRMRAIRYQRRGFAPQLLLTSLLNPLRFLAAEINARYHERWELELGYNEVKRFMLRREETTRSKSPRGYLRGCLSSGVGVVARTSLSSTAVRFLVSAVGNFFQKTAKVELRNLFEKHASLLREYLTSVKAW